MTGEQNDPARVPNDIHEIPDASVASGRSVLRGLVELETGKRLKGGGLSAGSVLSIGGEHIKPNGELDLTEPKYITEEFYQSLKQGRLRANDVLLVKDGATTGKLAHIKQIPSPHAAINEHVFIVRSRDPGRLDQNFLYFALSSSGVQQNIRELTHGLIGGITRPLVESLEIPLPPLPEQCEIVRVLSAVRNAIQTTDGVIEASRELRSSLIRYWFDEVGPSTLRFGSQTSLGDVAITVSGGTPSREKPEYFGGKIPWVKSGELDDNYITATEESITEEALENSNARVFPAGTVVVALYGATAGKTAILGVSAATNQAVCAIMPRGDSFTSTYMRYLLVARRDEILRARYGAAQPNISQGFLRNLRLSLPSVNEQIEVARSLESIEEKIQAEEARSVQLKQLYESLLQQLLSGRLRLPTTGVPNLA